MISKHSLSSLLTRIVFFACACLFAIQSANAATRNIVVNAFGDLMTECTGTPEVCNTTGPEFDLYINGTKVAGPQVVTETATDYTFNNITVPTSGNIEIDVHFFNDNWCGSPARAGCTGDHNFYINSIKIHEQTIDAFGQTVDYGSSYAQATDGNSLSTYNGNMYSDSALRVSTTFANCCGGILVAQYHLESGPWNGTAGETKDTAGYTGGPFDGRGISNPAQLVDGPALGNASAGTCGYAQMVTGTSEFRLEGLPLNTAAGTKTSVSFWMYWKGSENRMPLGWVNYDLWFRGGGFGFNTWANDLYGINHTGLANKWVHVVAVFTNGDKTGNEIYIDGVKQTLSQRRGTFNNTNAAITPNFQLAGSYSKTGFHWNDDYLDEVKIYNGAITQTQVTADFNATKPCTILRAPVDNLALASNGTTVTTSHVSPWEDLEGVNDNVATISSTVDDKNDGGPLVYGNWDGAGNYGATNWVSFKLNQKMLLSEFQVLWWEDGGGILAPTTAIVEYFDGTAWVSAGAIGTALDTFNTLDMGGVYADEVRVKMSSARSTGIIEVRIFGVETNKLIAEYHLDEPGWNGTAGEVKDSGAHINGPFHATSVDGPVASSDTPARAGDIGTCGYATFPAGGNSASIRMAGLPVDQTAGAQNAISFWLYWKGTGNMPLGFQDIDLWFSGDSMGFNTWDSDIYGISNAGMENRWVHVVAVITNGDMLKNQLYIDGVKQTLTQRAGTPNNGRVLATPNFAISGTPTRSNYRWNGGYIDEVRLYNSGITQSQVTADFNASHICNYELVAKYHMDEISWDGTAGEVRDTSSNGYHGEAINGATTKSKNRAIEDDSNGTCGYGVFNGANAGSRVNLPTNFPRLAGSKTITAWVKLYSTPTSGQYSRIFVDDTGGQFGYGLKVNNNGSINYFKRKSSGAKQNGNAYSLTLNEWYFIAFKLDDDTDSITFYTYDQTGTLRNTMTSTGYTDDITSNAPTGQGASIGAQRNGIHFMDGQIDELRIYKGALPTEAIEFIKDNTHPCGIYPVSNEDAHTFNCIAEQVPDTEVQTGHLYMQRAQQPFNIKVAALKADGTLETGFTDASAKDLTLAFLDKNNSNTPIAFYDPISASNVTSATVNFPVAGTGIVQVDGLSINKAYKRLTCQIIDSNGQTITGESTDAFSVRPTALTITSSANADDSGTTVDASPFIKTGSEFTLSATGLAGYDGTLLIDTNSSNLTAHTGSHQKGSLTGTFATAAEAGSGTATGSGFKYSEVGYFKLAANSIYDNGDYTNVDSDAGDCTDDFSNTTVAGQYGCKFGNTETNYFGRFIPDHFNIKGVDDTDSTVAGCQINAAPADAFTYYGYGENEDGINTKFSIEAVNATNVITKNYKDSYATLDVTTWNDTNASTGLRFSATNIPAGASLLKSNPSTTGSWLTGSSGNIMAYHYVPRLNTPMAPAEIDIQVTPVDRDGVTTADGNPVSVTSLHKRKFKYGRVKMTSVSGSNLRPLSMPIVIQSWNGTAYSTNEFDNYPDPNDNCTNIPLGKFSLSNYQQNLADGETTASVAGVVRKLSLSAPGVGNNGNVDITVNLTDFPWLDLGSIPTARASFGTRSGRSPVIYMRENF